MSPYELAPGESLPGFLVRASSVRNFSGKNAFVLSLDGWVPALDQPTWFKATMEGRIDLPSLSKLCEIPSMELEKGMVRLPPPAPGSPSDSSLATHFWRECPACTERFWYHRKGWALALVTACPEHNLRLADACADCGHPYQTGAMSRTFCAKCGSDRRTYQIATPEELECSTRLMRLLDEGGASHADLIALINRLMVALYMVTPDSLRGRFRASVQMGRIEDLAPLIPVLWRIACTDESLAQALAAQAQAFRTKWPALPGIGEVIYSRIERAIDWKLPKPSGNVHTDWTLPVEMNQIPMDAAAIASGHSPFVLHGLIEDGLLSEHWFTDPEGDSFAGLTRLISTDELNSVFSTLWAHAIPFSHYDGTRGKLYSVEYLDLGKIVSAQQRSELPVYLMADGSSLGVPYQLTERYREAADLPAWAMSTPDACSALGTYREMVDRMIRMGLLEGSSKANSWHLISRASIERFNERYILVGTLARQWKTNATNLKERLATLDIHPEPWGGTSNDGITAFRRDARLDEARDQVKMVKNYATKTGRKMKTVDAATLSPRRRRLQQLIQEHGSVIELQRKSSIRNLYYVYHGKRAFGHKLARKLEKALGLPALWMDG